MAKVMRMSEQLANMIAAGEVVDRPASVVKELVENAIDAGSTAIQIQLTDSGIRQIKVIDNGEGMTESDALLAFERHATSKVKNQFDIFRIQTLGFRGEALPSIASISDVHLRTSDGSQSGLHLNIKGGEVVSSSPAPLRKGTELEVNHLFFNTPARLKHIKSLNTELGHITDYVNKMALSHPEVAIKLENNGRILFQSNGQNSTPSILTAIYGFDIAKKMQEVAAQTDDFKLKGYISEPEISRASRNYITLIVNGRAIRNYPLTRAVLEAYHTFLPKDRFPIAVLHLELDPVLVDVNVHPAKLEVRFSKEEALKNFVQETVRKALGTVSYIPETPMKHPVPKTEPQEEKTPKPYMESLALSALAPELVKSREDHVKETAPALTPSNHASPSRNLTYPVPLKAKPAPAPDQPAKAGSPPAQAQMLELYYIGQLHGTYLLAQNEEGLYLIDQHAAMERVEYEKNYRLLGQARNDSMELMIPLVLEYPANEILQVRDLLPNLETYGFEVEEFGGTSLVVRSLPVWAQGPDAQKITEALIAQLQKNKKTEIGKLREAVAITMSCKGSIKANQYINEFEIQALLASLCGCTQPYTCPHGRPIIVKLTKYEIEKMFKRVQ